MYHNNGLKTLDHILIGFALGVAIVVLVLVPEGKFGWVLLLDFLVTHCLAFTLIYGGGGGGKG